MEPIKGYLRETGTTMDRQFRPRLATSAPQDISCKLAECLQIDKQIMLTEEEILLLYGHHSSSGLTPLARESRTKELRNQKKDPFWREQGLIKSKALKLIRKNKRVVPTPSPPVDLLIRSHSSSLSMAERKYFKRAMINCKVQAKKNAYLAQMKAIKDQRNELKRHAREQLAVMKRLQRKRELKIPQLGK